MQLSLASVLSESARFHPESIAVVDGPSRLTYREVWARVASAAGALTARGIGPGDHVAILAPNVTDFVVAYYATLAVGGVVVPVPPMLVPEEIAYLLADSGATLVLAHPLFLANAVEGAASGPAEVLATSPAGGPAAGAEAVDDLATLAATATPLDLVCRRSSEDPAVLFYTSGTTGRPKGAVLTHGNLVMNAMVSAFLGNGRRPDDVVLVSLPLFHTFGQSVAMNAMFLAGARLVLQPVFQAGEALDLMLAEGVTLFLGVPTMYIALLEAARGRDRLPTLRVAASGGAPLPAAVGERFKERFGIQILEGYGLSETSPVAVSNQERFGNQPGSVGHPHWGVDARIARSELEDRIELLPSGELGEIVISGHNIFSGYHNNPEATRAALVDGWFRTGDLGWRAPDGRITVVDRKKDMIIRGGYNVYPREVEEVLAHLPGVAQVAVIGTPDELRGEEIVAVVVPSDPASPPDAEALIAYAREHLAKHKYPRRVEFVDSLPLGPSRKVLKRELRRRFGSS
ncbi:MAG: long-chain-fatty-acid--CoA ligase [Frankia sp.]